MKGLMCQTMEPRFYSEALRGIERFNWKSEDTSFLIDSSFCRVENRQEEDWKFQLSLKL